jgi:hypothetical protein
MKGLILSVSLVALIAYNACAQKVYIACPTGVNAKPNVGFLDKQYVNLIITDSRTIPANGKIECQGSDVVQALKQFLQSSFPSCKMNLLTDTLNASKPNSIAIKINIMMYQASLSTAECTGSVNYHVTIIDSRNGKVKKLSEDISNDTSKPDIIGYKAAKKCLFASFDKSNQDLLSFIKSSLGQ